MYSRVVPASASVALTGCPMAVPAAALLATLRVALAPSENTGGLFGGAAVASIVTVILAVSFRVVGNDHDRVRLPGDQRDAGFREKLAVRLVD